MPTKRQLTHYGVKGMHWGVVRDRVRESADRLQGGPAVKTKQGGSTVTARNGKVKQVELSKTTKSKNSASEDAAKAAVLRTRAKTKSTDSLSNKELQALVTRMNLEQQYTRLAVPQKTGVSKFVSDFINTQGKQEANKFLQQQLAQQVANALKKD